MGKYVKCTICGEKMNPEHPSEGGRAMSPLTMRWGWIHNWCLIEEIEQMTPKHKEKYDAKFMAECQ